MGDVALLYVSLFLMLKIRGGEAFISQFWDVYFVPFTILNVAWVLVFFMFNLYSTYKIRGKMEFAEAFVQSMIVNGLITIAFFYLVSIFGISPKTNLALYLIIFSTLFILWRILAKRIFAGSIWRRSVVFIGLDTHSRSLADTMIRDRSEFFEVIEIIYDDHFNRLISIRKNRNIDIIVAGNSFFHDCHENLFRFVAEGVVVVDTTTFWEFVYRKIPVRVADTAWFLSEFRRVKRREFEIVKRFFDIFISLFFGTIFCIPVIIISISLKLSGGSVIYSQMRVGKNQKSFKLYKFRTMIQNAESDGIVWAKKNDPRVTKLGAILRHTHLDELPQLWNILKGEMSFVGPRPERPEIIEKLEVEIPFYSLRHLVKPGISGWAQINYHYGSTVEDSLNKLCYDLYYIKHRSIFLDIKIILKTTAMLIKGEGR